MMMPMTTGWRRLEKFVMVGLYRNLLILLFASSRAVCTKEKRAVMHVR